LALITARTQKTPLGTFPGGVFFCLLSFYDGLGPVIAMGQLFVPMAGRIFKGDPNILTGLRLFCCSNPRCGTRRVSTGKGLGKGALDLVGPASAMFNNLVNNSTQGNLLTLLGNQDIKRF
jgi:hypothetical protein